MKKVFTILFMLTISLSIFGQSDEILDSLYEDKNANAIYSAMIVLQATGELGEDATVEEAKTLLETKDWGRFVVEDGEYITAGTFSLMVMESFKLPHGVMYSLLPIKRYALKEMVYLGYILGTPYPGDIMTSFDVVYAISSVPVDESINDNYIETVALDEVKADSGNSETVVETINN